MDYTLLYKFCRKEMVKKTLYCSILILLLIGMTGCVYLRFLKVKHQLEHFDKNFEIDDSGGLTLIFLNPVLEDGDIEWLMSSKPEKNSSENGERILTYILEKRYFRVKNDSENYDIPVRFIIKDGRLSTVTLPERFLKYFSKALFKNLLNSFGKAEIKKLRKEAKSSVRKSDEYRLPTTQQITEVLGKPYYRKKVSSDTVYIYKYHINTTGPEDRPGVHFEYYFDGKDNTLRSVKSNIKGMDVYIDFSDAV